MKTRHCALGGFVLLAITGCIPQNSGQSTTESAAALFATPLVLPTVPADAPNPQFVSTDITQVNYTCGGASASAPVTGHGYPGRALKLCVDLSTPSSLTGVVAQNILSNCLPPAAMLPGPTPSTGASPYANYAISGISAFNDQGEPAHVLLTGIACNPTNVVNPATAGN